MKLDEILTMVLRMILEIAHGHNYYGKIKKIDIFHKSVILMLE